MRLDPSTVSDLGIMPGGDDPDFLTWHDATWSLGGKHKLRELLLNPLDTAQEIRDRQRVLRGLAGLSSTIARRDIGELLARTSRYAESNIEALPGNVVANWFVRRRYRDLAPDIEQGLLATHRLLHVAVAMADALGALASESPELGGIERDLRRCVDLPQCRALFALGPTQLLAHERRPTLDKSIRWDARTELRGLISAMHLLDALQSLAQLSLRPGFTYPEVVESDAPVFDVRGLFHPLVKDPVPNDVAIGVDGRSRVIFLTGPNMAGKTTLMRACGLTVLLAHVGAAVPAAGARLSVFDRLFAALTVRDSVSRGESFFLAEARRVGTVVAHVTAGERVFALLDEMFKGTNVLDAHDATELVVAGLSQSPRSAFIIASHLVEVAERLERFQPVAFQQMNVERQGDAVRFTFLLEDGVSHQRLGMFLLEREGVARSLRQLSAAGL